MLNIIKSFGTLVVSAFNFISHSIETLVSVFTTIPRFLQYVSSVISLVIPNEITPFLLVAVSLMLMMMIIGRNS